MSGEVAGDVSEPHPRPFACGRCGPCELGRWQECQSPRGGCTCATCRPSEFVTADGEVAVTAVLDELTRVRHELALLQDVAAYLQDVVSRRANTPPGRRLMPYGTRPMLTTSSRNAAMKPPRLRTDSATASAQTSCDCW